MQPPRHAAILLLAALAFPLAGADFAALQPKGYVNDFAGAIRDPAIARELEDYCARVEQSTGAQIALVTITDLEGEPIEDVANLLFRKWGVGSKKNNEGVLVLLAIANRRTRVEVGYGLEPYLPDGFAGGILRGMRPALRSGDYGAALAEGARQIAERVAAGKGVQIGARAPRRSGPPVREQTPWPNLIASGLFVLFVLWTLGRSARRTGYHGGRRSGAADLLTGMLIGNLLSGGRSYRSGGGFGGYDSGGGFGGFGGGDSGGGGASSDW
jgi:uncharacterized protein